MFRVIMRGLLARKFRLFATALAVTLGVAFMAGTMVLTDTIGHTFNDLSTGVYKGTDAEVRAKAAFSGPAMGGGDQRPLISDSLVQSLRRVPGVAADEGSAMGYARLTGKNGKALGNPAAGAPTLGGNWNHVSQLNPWTLVAGHPPQAADQVVIDKKSATDGHLRVGDMTTVLALGAPQRFRVVGIVKFGTADSPGGASVALFTMPVAQRLVAGPGKLTNVLFVAKPGVSQQQLAANLRHMLPHGMEAVTGATVTKEMQDSFQQAMGFFNTFMMIFAVIALLVGAFMIFNTFSITVAQRTRENGLLRALGASKRQVLGSVIAEAVAVGVIASAIGLAAGIAMAAGLEGLLQALGFLGLPIGGIVFSIRTVIVAGLAGLLVTLAAALSPARKAAKVSPVAAMQEVSAGSTGYGSKQRILVGAALLVLGVAALFTGLFAHVGSQVLVVGAGALLVFFAVSVLGRTVSLPLSRAVGAPLPRMRGIPGKLARANAMRNPKRTAASASALMIGVGLVGFITILASSTTASINRTIDRSFAGDIVIDSGAGMTGGIDPALAQELARLPQVSAVAGIRGGLAEIFGKPEQIAAVDPGTIGKIFHVGSAQGSTGGLGRTGIAVYKDVATAHHLRVGSAVPVVFRDTGPADAAGRADLRGFHGGAGAALLLGHVRVRCQLHVALRQRRGDAEGARDQHRGRAEGGAGHRDEVLRHHGDGPDGVQGRADQAVPATADARVCAARAGHLHRAARHRQHPGIVDLRAHPGTGRDARGRDDQAPAAGNDPVGVGDHRVAGYGPRPAGRGVLRLGAGAGYEEPGHHGVQPAGAEPGDRGGAGRGGRPGGGDPAQPPRREAQHPARDRQRIAQRSRLGRRCAVTGLRGRAGLAGMRRPPEDRCDLRRDFRPCIRGG